MELMGPCLVGLAVGVILITGVRLYHALVEEAGYVGYGDVVITVFVAILFAILVAILAVIFVVVAFVSITITAKVLEYILAVPDLKIKKNIEEIGEDALYMMKCAEELYIIEMELYIIEMERRKKELKKKAQERYEELAWY